MSQAPRVKIPTVKTPSTTRRRREPLSESDLNKLIDNAAENTRDLFELAQQVYAQAPGDKLGFPAPRDVERFTGVQTIEVGRTEVRRLVNDLVRSISSLKGDVQASKTSKKKTNRAIRHKVFITDTLREFFINADLRNEYVEQNGYYVDSGVPLMNALPLLRDEGYAYSETISNLFYIYMNIHGLYANKRNIYRADQYMLDVLGPTFDTFTRLDIAKPRTNVKGDIIPPFNAQSFNLTGFNRIIRFNRYFRPEEKDKVEGAPILDETQLAMLNDPIYDDELNKESAVTVTTKKAWQAQNRSTSTEENENDVEEVDEEAEEVSV